MIDFLISVVILAALAVFGFCACVAFDEVYRILRRRRMRKLRRAGIFLPNKVRR